MAKRPSIRLSPEEAWDTIERSHTGILTTLRHDGVPVALPVWFVALDRRVYTRTPGRTKKVARIRHDPRASFLVESGERWAELKAVHLTGRASLMDDPELEQRFETASEEKYGRFRMARTDMPSDAQERYGQTWALICFEPDERILSWDNACMFGE